MYCRNRGNVGQDWDQRKSASVEQWAGCCWLWDEIGVTGSTDHVMFCIACGIREFLGVQCGCRSAPSYSKGNRVRIV